MPPENKAPTIDEVMASAWDEILGEDSTELSDQREHLGGISPNQDSEDSATETSKEASTVEDTTSEQPAGDEAVEKDATSETKSDEAPTHWPAEDRQMFAKLNKESKDFLLRRHKQMEADYTRKTQENAEAIKVGSTLVSGLDETVRAAAKNGGVTMEQFTKNMVDWHNFSSRDPVGFVKLAVQALKLDPAEVFGLAKDPNAPKSEEKDPVAKRVEALEARLAQEQESRNRKLFEETNNKVTEFSTEKDAAGNLLRPHFEQVRKTMAMLLKADRSLTLNDAYEVAVFRDPELRKTIVGQPAAPTDTDKINRAKKAAQAAKSNIKSTSVSAEKATKDEAPRKLSDVLKSVADEVGM